MRHSRGFTLVELLVVISIMSILTVITVSQFTTAKQKARDVQRKADLSSVAKALELYLVDYGKFPTAANGTINVSGTTWGGTFTDASGYVYMKVMPKENTSTNPPYCYAVSADGKKFALFAQLENLNDLDLKHDAVTKAILTSTCNTRTYNYYINSPNTSLNADGSFN